MTQACLAAVPNPSAPGIGPGPGYHRAKKDGKIHDRDTPCSARFGAVQKTEEPQLLATRIAHI
ncbi:hypothetical protein THITH_00865 [Thioalkalivibrio paradoxus ARh 1]|uniref:Uncharacterized protein n=1 Tax=Thioalkalivibrio paradoxus ARh 1 TaxID=713585 RepID=W0DMZ6_9GAMM|nr:hypothetical protein THITH_00865 [Thioalkalivibrio paradoxus ARh 1]